MSKKYQTERQMQADKTLRGGDFKSIREAIERVAGCYPDNPIFAELNDQKEIVSMTGREVLEEMMNLGEGLIRSGLQGRHIAIVAENCVRYVMSDITISSGVGIVTPIDVNAPVELLAKLLEKCDATAVMCSSFCLNNLKKAAEIYNGLTSVITLDRKVDGYPFYEEIVSLGKEVPASESIYRNLTLDVNAPAKILFTSGTTGANKGVVLTQANLAANTLNCMDVIQATDENTSMSVLPMHHATEINTHIMARVASGRLTYINGNMKDMMTNIKIFKPDFITIVPMIMNAFYKNIMINVRKAGKEEKLKKGIKISNLLRKFGIDKTHSMFADIYAPFGGNLSNIVCGGSMLNPVVIKGMNDLGIRVENGYGITECGPLISMNGNTLTEHLSVGKPCPALEAKILNPDSDGIGELCIRGNSVAKGYYKDEEATRQVFGEDGFFNTGDSAWINGEGKIFLVGRKKNTIVLENGKNVCPEEVENVIETRLDYADEIVVYQADFQQGNVKRQVLCAGLYISDEARRADREAIKEDISRINALLDVYKHIDYVELPDTAYPKTSTRKIQRRSLPTECSGNGLQIM